MARFDGFVAEFTDHSAAATQTASDAMYHLGLAYCAGKDVPFDLVSAHKWLNLAALRGHVDAKTRRMEISSDMTKGEIAEAQRQAREWLNRPTSSVSLPIVILTRPKSKKAGRISLSIADRAPRGRRSKGRPA